MRHCWQLLLVLVTIFLASGASALDFKAAEAAFKDKDYATAFAAYAHLARLGHGPSSARLASMYDRGRGVEQSLVSAYAWYKMAEHQGEKSGASKAKSLKRKLTDAQRVHAEQLTAELSDMYSADALSDTLYPQSSTEFYQLSTRYDTPGLEWPKEYRITMQAGSVFLEYDLDENGGPVDFRLLRESPEPFVRETIRYLRTRKFDSVVRFGRITRYTFYIKNRDENYRNYGEAKLLRRLKKRAEIGSPHQKYFYAYAMEVHQALHAVSDPASFNEWYLNAAVAGHAKSQYLLGNRLLQGDGMIQDADKAVKWLKLAHNNGSGEASYLLSRLHPDQPDLLNKAADAGHTTAMLHLARQLAHSNQTEAAIDYLERAEGHLDKKSWLMTAAAVYQYIDPQRASAYLREASSTN